MEDAVRTALVIVIGLIATACAPTGPTPRPLVSGFAGAGVADPYADGKRHLAAGRYEIAIERFGQALADDRQALDALNGLAIAYTRVGRFDIAQTHFERALQISPDDPVTLNNYGRALIDQGRLREARPFLEQALEHAAAPDALVVAGNIERIRDFPPPALVVALTQDNGLETDRDRVVLVAPDVHRLDLAPGPDNAEASVPAARPGAALAVAPRSRDKPIQLVPKTMFRPEPTTAARDEP
jgi:tetratricopeptide (TPR) repeat protein